MGSSGERNEDAIPAISRASVVLVLAGAEAHSTSSSEKQPQTPIVDLTENSRGSKVVTPAERASPSASEVIVISSDSESESGESPAATKQQNQRHRGRSRGKLRVRRLDIDFKSGRAYLPRAAKKSAMGPPRITPVWAFLEDLNEDSDENGEMYGNEKGYEDTQAN